MTRLAMSLLLSYNKDDSTHSRATCNTVNNMSLLLIIFPLVCLLALIPPSSIPRKHLRP